ncbi:MAG: hypothetical protein FJ108_03910 [Deltaproteobacteria bacterium]|nr:hypothetical protein [Deltaproteobacteria bacterium]
MLRGALIAIAVFGLAACGQQGDRGTPEVGAARGAPANEYAATCLETAAAQNWAEAARLCSLALGADPNDESLAQALAAAKAALAGDAAAEGVAEPADDAAEQALPN